MKIVKIHWGILKKSSSTEPLSHFQPNLAQSIIKWRWFNFFSKERSSTSEIGVKCKIVNIHYWKLFKSSSPEPLGHFQPKLAHSIGFNFIIRRSNPLHKKGDNYKKYKYIDKFLILFLQNIWTNSTKPWHKAYRDEGDLYF